MNTFADFGFKGFGVGGWGFRNLILGSSVEGLGFRVKGLGVWDLGARNEGAQSN